MSLFIGICNSQDIVPADFFWSFMSVKKPTEFRVFRSRHPWDVVRNNMIISDFLRSGCDIMAKMDIDQIYPSDYFERLVPSCLEHKVVGPLIYDRWEENGYMPLAFSVVNSGMFPVEKMKLDGLSGIVEVPYPHTNLLYHREVLEKVSPPWYQAYLAPDGLRRMNHVDYTFIEKIHKAGYKVMIDLDCEVKHQETRFVGEKECQR
ncbi:MAG: hypothetical protein V2A70_00890 [Candidatus Omnitrophota bacterium]